MVAWNVRGFRAGAGRAAVAVGEASPDVALLTEVGGTGRRLRSFAHRLGMERASGARFLRRGIANAVLVRPPWRIVEHEVVAFSHRAGTIPRGMILAVVGRSGFRVTAVALHLGLADPERVAHARELTDRLPLLGTPLVVGGDLNEPPEAPAAGWVADRLWDAFAAAGRGPGATYPAVGPLSRIDYVFVSEGMAVERAWVQRTDAAEAASDHLPVFADLRIED